MKDLRKLQHGYFYDEVYRFNIIFICNIKNNIELLKLLKKKYKGTYEDFSKQIEDRRDKHQGTVYWNGNRILIVIFVFKDGVKDTDIIGTIAHECLHATFYALFKRGVDIGISADEHFNEHFCYYHEMLLSKVLKPYGRIK